MNSVAERKTVPSLIRNVVANIHPETHTFMTHKVKDEWVEISYKETLEKARKAAFAIAADGEYLNRHPQLRDMVYQKTDDTFSILGSG